MAEQRSREGQQLGNYRLERLLGSGGFAEVYLGYHLRLQRQAAIKVLHASLSKKEIAGFQREAQIIAALDHPGIVRVFDFDVQQGIPFLVMDYLPNGTLRQRYQWGERLALSTVVSYVKQVADALKYAHDQRLIHRDIKPENMLFGRRQEVVLSDFGIAAIAHSTASMTAQPYAGTIYYMAPEQIQAQARPASDQYALAIVAYEWLCGERPFQGTYPEILSKHLMTPPPSLREKVPQLPAEVEQVIMTALAKDPRQRYPGVQEFAAALERASQPTESIYSHPPSPLPLPDPVPPAPPLSAEVPLTVQGAGEDQMKPVTARAILSRRAVLTGATGLVMAGIVGTGIWWFTHPSQNRISPSPQGTQQPSRPQGTLFVTYRGHSDSVYSVSWSPDGKRIASGSADKTVQLWNVSDSRYSFTYRGHTATVESIVWFPPGRRAASGSWDRTVQIWNTADGSNIFTYRGHTDAVFSVSLSPDSRRIASGSRDNTVRVWDALDSSNPFIYRGHTNAVFSVAWSPDGKRIASGSGDNTVQVWDAVDGSKPYTYNGHSGIVYSVSWSPDGKLIASCSDDDTVQVWEAANGRYLFAYRGHTAAVNSVSWSPDGKHIASSSDDKTVQVWNASDGSGSFIYRGHTDGVIAVAWSPEGKRIASCSYDNTVQVWQGV